MKLFPYNFGSQIDVLQMQNDRNRKPVGYRLHIFNGDQTHPVEEVKIYTVAQRNRGEITQYADKLRTVGWKQELVGSALGLAAILLVLIDSNNITCATSLVALIASGATILRGSYNHAKEKAIRNADFQPVYKNPHT